MAKWVSIFLVIFFIGNASYAQKNKLTIEGTSPKLYLLHTVVPKENFYSIGRLYNVTAKELASYNNLQFENGLSVGESIKIPLTENNFLQSGSAGESEALIPVYHSVLPKEGLYRVSISYNKVPLTSIKKWNHLQSDNVSIGTSLIVGFLKVNKTESILASKSVKTNIENTPDGKTEAKPIPPAPVVEDRMPPVKKPDVEKDTSKAITTAPQADEHKVTVTTVNTKSTVNFSGGYFKKLYDDQAEKKSPVSETGSGSTFKSTSGWQDGKYYCFNNDAPPGSVIKITDNVTNKSVYAKVLDAIPDIKQNAGFIIIISNAAAEELGSGDKFECALSYVK